MLKENITFTYLVDRDSHALSAKVLVRKTAKAFSRFTKAERVDCNAWLLLAQKVYNCKVANISPAVEGLHINWMCIKRKPYKS